MRTNVIKYSLRVRILVYALVLGIVAVVLVREFTEIWIKRDYWEEQIEKLQGQTLQLAQETKAAFQEVRLKLLRFQYSRDAEDRDAYETAAQAFHQTLNALVATSELPEIKALLQEIVLEFQRYHNQSLVILDNLPPPEAIGPTAELFETIEDEARRILVMDQRMTMAKQSALRSLLNRARLDIEDFETSLYAGFVLLTGCLISLAVMVYRELIAPLQRQVVSSNALLERQEKLGALGLMAAGLAHEIRNPLNSIKARLYTQRRLLGSESPGLEDNRFIDEEIDRLEGIIQDALQFGRPNPPSPRCVDVRELLKGLGDMVRPELEKSRINLRLEVETSSKIWADPAQLKQALLNLIRNAMESIEHDGEIILRGRDVPWVGRKSKNQSGVALEVIDNGPGLSKEARARLFDPFFTTKPHGTGLGLSITARLVYAQDGQIECQSTPGQGALFAVVLPQANHYENDPDTTH